MRLDARARQDVAILGSGFLKLDGKFSHSLFIVLDQFESNILETFYSCMISPYI